LFGISIPIYEVPGIGASILIIPLLTFRATSISLLCLFTLFTATPAGIANAYLTTVGPIVIPTTFAGILKLLRTVSITLASFLYTSFGCSLFTGSCSPSILGYFQLRYLGFAGAKSVLLLSALFTIGICACGILVTDVLTLLGKLLLPSSM